MIAGGWVNASDALKAVDFQLLALIGAALGLSKAVEESGLAGSIAWGVTSMHMSAEGALFIVAFITMIITNLVTNNAAAALAVPIATSIADEMNVSYKSSSFVDL